MIHFIQTVRVVNSLNQQLFRMLLVWLNNNELILRSNARRYITHTCTHTHTSGRTPLKKDHRLISHTFSKIVILYPANFYKYQYRTLFTKIWRIIHYIAIWVYIVLVMTVIYNELYSNFSKFKFLFLVSFCCDNQHEHNFEYFFIHEFLYLCTIIVYKYSIKFCNFTIS